MSAVISDIQEIKRYREKSGAALSRVVAQINKDAYEDLLRSEAAIGLDAMDKPPHTDYMSTITREELDAKLAANVAEVKAISAETKAEVTAMRSENKAEMAAMRAENAATAAKIDAQFAALSAAINAIGSKIDGVEKGVEGKIDGLKTSMSTMQWVLATLIAIAGLAAAIVPLLKSDASTTPAPQPQVIVVQPASTVSPPAVPTPTK